MKITKSDYNALRVRVGPFMCGTTERERWGALWISGGSGSLYSYLNDNHIDTALRRIQTELADGMVSDGLEVG